MKKSWVNWGLLMLIGSLLTAEAAAAENEETPSMELLEFLGNWETQDGEWLDPIELLEELEADPQTAQVEEQSDG